MWVTVGLDEHAVDTRDDVVNLRLCDISWVEAAEITNLSRAKVHLTGACKKYFVSVIVYSCVGVGYCKGERILLLHRGCGGKLECIL